MFTTTNSLYLIICLLLEEDQRKIRFKSKHFLVGDVLLSFNSENIFSERYYFSSSAHLKGPTFNFHKAGYYKISSLYVGGLFGGITSS